MKFTLFGKGLADGDNISVHLLKARFQVWKARLLTHAGHSFEILSPHHSARMSWLGQLASQQAESHVVEAKRIFTAKKKDLPPDRLDALDEKLSHVEMDIRFLPSRRLSRRHR